MPQSIDTLVQYDDRGSDYDGLPTGSLDVPDSEASALASEFAPSLTDDQLPATEEEVAIGPPDQSGVSAAEPAERVRPEHLAVTQLAEMATAAAAGGGYGDRDEEGGYGGGDDGRDEPPDDGGTSEAGQPDEEPGDAQTDTTEESGRPEAILERRAAALDRLRKEDLITSVEYAEEIVKVWSVHADHHQPSTDGVPHTNRVHSMLEDSERVREAFQRGYAGVRYPFALGFPIPSEMTAVFGRPITIPGKAADQQQTARARSIAHMISEAHGRGELGDHDPRAYSSFVHQIIGAHTLYDYLDRRISQGYKASVANPEGFRIMPGKEEFYWSSRIFGTPNSPGIYETQGSLARLMQSIRATAEDWYGEKADDYLDAWWATVNASREQ